MSRAPILTLPFLVAAVSLTAASEPATPHTGFSEWANRYRGAHTLQARAALESEGARLAQARRGWLKELIQTDPQRAWAEALPEKVRRELPAAVTQHLEERIRERGFFGVWCALPADDDDHTGRTHRQDGFEREVVFGGKRYRAFVFGAWRDQITVDNVLIEGIAVDDVLAVGDTSPPPGEPPTGGPVVTGAPSKTGVNKLLYMIAQFSDETNFPITAATALSRMEVVSEFFQNNSAGAVSLTGLVDNAVMDVTFVTLPQPTSYAPTYNNSLSTLLNHARAAASSNGYSYASYNLDVVVTTNPSNSFSYAGKAFVGSQGAHLRYDYTTLRTAGHELGHNLGLRHANYWRTDATRPFARDSVPGGYVTDRVNDEWVEYGHYFSLMSAQSFSAMNDATKPHYAATEKVYLGWLSGDAVQYVSSNGTYRLYRHDHRDITNTPRAIRIQTTATDYTGNARRYWLNYRYVNFDTSARDWIRNGAQVDVAKTTYGSDGAIQLDMTPYTMNATTYIDQTNKPSSYWTVDNNDKRDGTLLIGRTYSDTAAGIHITPIGSGNSGANAEYLDIVINLGAFPGNHPPTIQSFAATAMAVATNQNVTFTASATDPDGDPLAYAWDFDQVQTFTASGLNTNSATKSWPTNGHYRVVLTVSDRKGGIATESMIVTVGSPANNRQIFGRVLQSGLPVYNARITTSAGTTNYQAWTESDGSYALTDLSSVPAYTVQCQCDGLTFTAQFTNPVSVASANRYGIDFHANQLLAGGALAVVPYETAIATGQNGQFTALRWDASGNPVASSPTWSVTGGGVIGNDGVFLAAAPGTNLVIATDGALIATATVWTAGAPVAVLAITASDSTGSETGGNTAAFVLQRIGDTNGALAVSVTATGTASNGSDYASISSPITIPKGQSQTTVIVNPLSDAEAEGDETVRLTVLSGAGYLVGPVSNAVVTIADTPVDDWRKEKFGANANTPAIAGDTADPDGDGIPNLLEYGLSLEPLAASVTGLPTAKEEAGYLTLTYRKNKAATDVTFTVEARSSLTTGPWDNTGIIELSSDDMGDYWLVKVRDSVPISSAGSRFLRLRVTR